VSYNCAATCIGPQPTPARELRAAHEHAGFRRVRRACARCGLCRVWQWVDRPGKSLGGCERFTSPHRQIGRDGRTAPHAMRVDIATGNPARRRRPRRLAVGGVLALASLCTGVHGQSATPTPSVLPSSSASPLPAGQIPAGQGESQCHLDFHGHRSPTTPLC